MVVKTRLPELLHVMAPSFQLENTSNFVRKVKRKKSNKLNELFPLVSQPSASKIGPHLQRAGITEEWLKNSESSQLSGPICVTNAIVCELNDYRVQNNHTWQDARRWLCTLLGMTEDQFPPIGTVETQFKIVKHEKEKV